jgi:hypothetical protein
MLPITLLVLYGIYIAVLIIAPVLSADFEDTLDGFFPANLRFIVGGILLGVFALILVVNLMNTGSSKGPALRGPGTSPGAEMNRFKPVQPAPARTMPPSTPATPPPPPSRREEPAPKPQPAPSNRTIISYPSEVEGGIYGETFIELGQQKVLKLRSLVVEASYLD